MSVISISKAVGLKAPNRYEDVIKVQAILNHFIGNGKLVGYKALPLVGKCGPKTREAIMAFQFQNGLISDEHWHCQIRPHGKTIAFMNKHAGHIPLPAKSEDEKLLDLLWQVDPDSLTNDLRRRNHLARLRRFFIRGLQKEIIDDSYWTFSYYDGFNRPRACYEKHSVFALEPSKIKQRALQNFRNLAKNAESPDEVAKALAKVEEAVACSTFLLIRWHHQNEGTSDGSLDQYEEMRYLHEVKRLVARNRPESIYFLYQEELAAIFPILRALITTDHLWQLRQSGVEG